MLVWIRPKDILGLDFPCLEDGLLSLFIEFLRHDLQLIISFGQRCILILQLILGPRELIGQLLEILVQFIQPT